MDLTARRLAGTVQHAEIADHAAQAAIELIGAAEMVLRIQVAEDLTVTVRRSRPTEPGAVGADTAEETTVAVPTTAGEPPVPAAVAARDDEAAVRELADLALSRRTLVRGDGPAGDGQHSGTADRIASPLRAGDGVVGVLVLARRSPDGPFDAADTALVEQLSAHVALAVARSGAHSLRSGANGAADTVSPLPPPARRHDTYCDLVAVVRELTLHARALAERQGQDRRVAVLAPARAIVQLPEQTVRELVRATYELVMDATEPGSNVAVELLAQEDDWELVVAHSGDAIPTSVLEASTVAAVVGQLGGEVESGQGAGVARLRILLLGCRVPERSEVPGAPVASN